MLERTIWYSEGEHEGGPHSLEEIQYIMKMYGLKDPKVSWSHLPGKGVYFSKIDKPFHIYSLFSDETRSFSSFKEIKEALDLGQITKDSEVFSISIPSINGWKLEKLLKRGLVTEPSAFEFIKTRMDSSVSILSGANNSGKTFFLKNLKIHLGQQAQILLTGRIKQIGAFQYNEKRLEQLDQENKNFLAQFYANDSNEDNSNYQIEKVFGLLNNNTQDKLTHLISAIIGDEVQFLQTDKNRRQSPWSLYVNDQSINTASTGTRLLITLLTACFDDNYEYLLIDEPELGLSPKSQKKLASILLNDKNRKDFFPHLKGIMLSTHSHLFLDRKNLSNNFIVNKSKRTIEVTQVKSISQFHTLQFEMLGLDFRSLFLPESIILVEGKTDYEYFKRLTQLFVPDHFVAIQYAEGAGNLLEKTRELQMTLGDLRSSPYRKRLFIVLDEVHNTSEVRLVKKGVIQENIIQLSKNGIEHYYPSEVITKIFHCGYQEYHDALSNQSNNIELNGISMSKTFLSSTVIKEMNRDTTIPIEINDFLEKIRSVCQLGS